MDFRNSSKSSKKKNKLKIPPINTSSKSKLINKNIKTKKNDHEKYQRMLGSSILSMKKNSEIQIPFLKNLSNISVIKKKNSNFDSGFLSQNQSSIKTISGKNRNSIISLFSSSLTKKRKLSPGSLKNSLTNSLKLSKFNSKESRNKKNISNVSIDVNKEIDPDSSKLNFILKEYDEILKDLPPMEKIQHKMLTDNFEYDQKIDYIQKFILKNRMMKNNLEEDKLNVIDEKNKIKQNDLVKEDLIVINEEVETETDLNNLRNYDEKKSGKKKIENLHDSQLYKKMDFNKLLNFYAKDSVKGNKKKVKKSSIDFNLTNKNIKKDKDLIKYILKVEKDVLNIQKDVLEIKNNDTKLNKVLDAYNSLESKFKKDSKIKSKFSNYYINKNTNDIIQNTEKILSNQKKMIKTNNLCKPIVYNKKRNFHNNYSGNIDKKNLKMIMKLKSEKKLPQKNFSSDIYKEKIIKIKNSEKQYPKNYYSSKIFEEKKNSNINSKQNYFNHQLNNNKILKKNKTHQIFSNYHKEDNFKSVINNNKSNPTKNILKKTKKEDNNQTKNKIIKTKITLDNSNKKNRKINNFNTKKNGNNFNVKAYENNYHSKKYEKNINNKNYFNPKTYENNFNPNNYQNNLNLKNSEIIFNPKTNENNNDSEQNNHFHKSKSTNNIKVHKYSLVDDYRIISKDKNKRNVTIKQKNNDIYKNYLDSGRHNQIGNSNHLYFPGHK